MALWTAETGELVTRWKADATITAAVGATTAARIYRGNARQGVPLPYIVYLVAGGQVEVAHAGPANLAHAILHIYVYGVTADQANVLAEYIAADLRSVAKGRLITAGTWIDNIECSIPDDAEDPPINAADEWKYWARIVATVHYVT